MIRKNLVKGAAISLALCMALTGCGKKEENGGPATEPTGQYQGEEETGISDAPVQEDIPEDIPEGNEESYNGLNYIGGYNLEVYRAGLNAIAFMIEGENEAPSAYNYYNLEVMDAEGTPIFGASLTYEDSRVSVAKTEKFGDTTSIYYEEIEGLGGFGNTKSVLSGNRMFIILEKPGLWDEIPTAEGTYELSIDMNILAKGSFPGIVRDVGFDEIEKIEKELRMAKVPEKPARAGWEGSYISGYYNTSPVYMTVDKTEAGLLCFHIVTRDQEFDLFGEESNYEESLYEDISYTGASCYISKDDGSNLASFSFNTNSANPDDASVDVYFYDNEAFPGPVYMRRSSGTWHSAPEGYEDKDRFGVLSIDEFDDPVFTPVTDDYMLIARGGTETPPSVYTDDGPIIGERVYELYSYDVNGIAVQYVDKYVMCSEADAAAAYEKIRASQDDYSKKMYTYTSKGSAIYVEHNIEGNGNFAKMMQIWNKFCDDWYVGANYMYDGSASEKSFIYAYVSKPITEQEYTMPLDRMLWWMGLDYEHPCTDDSNYYLRTEVNEYRISLSVHRNTDFTDEESYMSTLENQYLRYHGDTAEGIYVWYSEYADENAVYVHEYEFGEDEVKVTEYEYKYKGYNTHGITLDNYKAKTPDATYTHTFKVKQRELEQ